MKSIKIKTINFLVRAGLKPFYIYKRFPLKESGVQGAAVILAEVNKNGIYKKPFIISAEKTWYDGKFLI